MNENIKYTNGKSDIYQKAVFEELGKTIKEKPMALNQKARNKAKIIDFEDERKKKVCVTFS